MRCLLLGLCLVGLGCCGQPRTPHPAPPATACDKATVHSQVVPGVRDHHNRVETWDTTGGPLMTRDAITALNRRNATVKTGYRDVLSAELADEAHVAKELEERILWLDERLGDGRLVEGVEGDFSAAVGRIRGSGSADSVRAVHSETTLWCVPLTRGLYALPKDVDFDRNRCSGLHPGELVRVLRDGGDGWLYVHVGYAVGWVAQDVLTPELAHETARAFRDDGERIVALQRVPLPGGPTLRLGTSLPMAAADPLSVVAPTPTGLRTIVVAGLTGLHRGFLPLTRRHAFELALSQLGQPYGWGGRQGHRDCSRLTMDVFAAFGVRLSRHSSFQSRSGRDGLSLKGKTVEEKRVAIRAAGKRGLVLLYMSGHIMLYLGEDDGRPMAVSALSEFKRPCGEGSQTVRVDRVTVSDLELGRGTDKTAFIERITRLAVFGR